MAENSSVFRCALKVVMVAEIFLTEADDDDDDDNDAEEEEERLLQRQRVTGRYGDVFSVLSLRSSRELTHFTATPRSRSVFSPHRQHILYRSLYAGWSKRTKPTSFVVTSSNLDYQSKILSQAD